jgi:hypothetical protein
MLPLNDQCIRAALKHDLFARYSTDSKTLVLEELGLKHGSARVDIAVINGFLDGIEIKSDRDTLERLPGQIRVYNSVLDHITLVTGRRHLNEAVLMVPEWWGIQVVEAISSEDVLFSTIRQPRDNPALDILAVTKLLWRDEALSLLQDIGRADGFRYKPRATIYAHLVQVADPLWLCAMVRQQLRSRTNWRSDSPQTSCDG